MNIDRRIWYRNLDNEHHSFSVVIGSVGSVGAS